MEKLKFQQPLLQSLVSHDPLEIILMCWFGYKIISYYQLLLMLNF